MDTIRLTADNIQKIMLKNEGYEREKSYRGVNSWFTNYYKIQDGKLFRNETGKGAFGGSQYDDTVECTLEQARTFLRSVLNELDTDIF